MPKGPKNSLFNFVNRLKKNVNKMFDNKVHIEEYKDMNTITTTKTATKAKTTVKKKAVAKKLRLKK